MCLCRMWMVMMMMMMLLCHLSRTLFAVLSVDGSSKITVKRIERFIKIEHRKYRNKNKIEITKKKTEKQHLTITIKTYDDSKNNNIKTSLRNSVAVILIYASTNPVYKFVCFLK